MIPLANRRLAVPAILGLGLAAAVVGAPRTTVGEVIDIRTASSGGAERQFAVVDLGEGRTIGVMVRGGGCSVGQDISLRHRVHLLTSSVTYRSRHNPCAPS